MKSPMLIDDFLRFGSYGNRVAFIEQQSYRTLPLSYEEVNRQILRIRNGLRRLGLQPGDRLILWGANSARWAATFYACVLSRIVVIPVDASFSQDFVDRIQKATQAKFMCTDSDLSAWKQLFDAPEDPLAEPPADPNTLLEIVYTSGTTAEPKGVMITHGNILSNLIPVHNEIHRLKHYAMPFGQLGFVHLIPLSHLFGQIMGLFIPQILRARIIFAEPAAPNVVRTVSRHRASAIICVPRELSFLRQYVESRFGIQDPQKTRTGIPGILSKWWHYRRVHSDFGWKFWAF